MMICVMNELKEIRRQLKERGYNVVDEDINEACDAIICDLRKHGLNAMLSMENNIKQNGTLIIDSSNRTIEEIEYMINNKMYS